jgi:hypothetical protein
MYYFTVGRSDACQIRIDHFKFDKHIRQIIDDLIMSLDYSNLLIAKYIIENGSKMD